MRTEYIECACHTIEHTLVFRIFEDGEVYILFYLRHHENFFQRVWTALKYICKKGNLEFHETITSVEVLKRLL